VNGPLVFDVRGRPQAALDVSGFLPGDKAWTSEDVASVMDEHYRPLCATVQAILNLHHTAEWLGVEIPAEWGPAMVAKLGDASAALCNPRGI